MITIDRIKQLIEKHDKHPVLELGGLNFYSIYMQIVFEYNNIRDYQEWDYYYSREERKEIFREINKLIARALESQKECYA